jgi:hypothetical protein
MILPSLAIISLFRSGTRKLLESFKGESKEEEAAVGTTGGVRPSIMTTQKMTHFTIREIDFFDAIRNLSILFFLNISLFS